MYEGKKWFTTVEYYDEEGTKIDTRNMTNKDLEKYQKIRKFKNTDHERNNVKIEYIVRRKPEQGTLFREL